MRNMDYKSIYIQDIAFGIKYIRTTGQDLWWWIDIYCFDNLHV